METSLLSMKDLQMKLKQKESELKKLQMKYEVSISLISKERMKNQYLQSLIDSRKQTDIGIMDEIETAINKDDIIESNSTKKNYQEEKVKPIFGKSTVQEDNFIEEICLYDDYDDEHDKVDENLKIPGKDSKGIHEVGENEDILADDISDNEDDGENDIGSEQIEFFLDSGDEDMSIDEDFNSENEIDEAITQKTTTLANEEINSHDEQRMFTDENKSESKNLKKKKTRGCRKCEGCKFECLSCKFCLDKPKNGGKGTLRQACEKKQCKNLN